MLASQAVAHRLHENGTPLSSKQMRPSKSAHNNTYPRASVSLQDKKLLHPPTFLPSDEGRRDESEADVLRTLKRSVSMKPFTLSVPLKAVSVLRLSVGVLEPNIGDVVLIQLQHLLQCGEIVRSSFAEFERHSG